MSRETERTEKDFPLRVSRRKKSERNDGKKSLSASERRDRENRKRFCLRASREKRVRENAEKDFPCK